MAAATRDILALEVPSMAGVSPTVRVIEIPMLQGTVPIQHSFREYEQFFAPKAPSQVPLLLGPALPLARYLHTELLRCLPGDADERFVRGLSDSSLTSLRIEARNRP